MAWNTGVDHFAAIDLWARKFRRAALRSSWFRRWGRTSGSGKARTSAGGSMHSAAANPTRKSSRKPASRWRKYSSSDRLPGPAPEQGPPITHLVRAPQELVAGMRGLLKFSAPSFGGQRPSRAGADSLPIVFSAAIGSEVMRPWASCPNCDQYQGEKRMGTP